ncbi:MAG TPA: L-seryl-tRNA(Sec) selenium transferase [Methylomirabilota bacterium]|nr:L-seryl-tRNA(Sec) selenium transferase [Methylomirabilota bacterium]
MSARLRSIPSVEKVLQALAETGLPRALVVDTVRGELAGYRSKRKIPSFDETVTRVRSALESLRASRIRPVLNGTGILIHTNLGRAPLAEPAADAVRAVAAGYCNLEFDLITGERGDRASYLERALARLCGAEAATLVNNGAAALVLILRHFTVKKREVVISRSELIQIGGGFRIPEILEASGARLREVGTTNKTLTGDYSRAIGRNTGLILKVHRSNFFMGGFVESPAIGDLAALARKKRVPLIEDLGSGAVFDTAQFEGVESEPTPEQALKNGVDLVCFSGDKLFGGPQAGIIAGKAKLITALKQDPFFRAFRCDKLACAGLEATVDLHLRSLAPGAPSTARPNRDRDRETVISARLRASLEDLRKRAHRLLIAVEDLPIKTFVGEGKAQVGGGALPRSSIPSVTLDFMPITMSLEQFAERLRRRRLPVVGYLSGGRFKLDLRSLLPGQDEDLIRAIHSVFRRGGRSDKDSM